VAIHRPGWEERLAVGPENRGFLAGGQRLDTHDAILECLAGSHLGNDGRKLAGTLEPRLVGSREARTILSSARGYDISLLLSDQIA
jgi:hypothetical protein